MKNLASVQQYLGVTEAVGFPETNLDFVDIIRKGLPVSVFSSLCDQIDLSEEMVAKSLRIATRTAARRKQQGGLLKPHESELVLRLARVMADGADVLGSEEKAKKWLIADCRALGGKQPITLLDTDIGFQDVMDVFGRIEHGVYS